MRILFAATVCVILLASTFAMIAYAPEHGINEGVREGIYSVVYLIVGYLFGRKDERGGHG